MKTRVAAVLLCIAANVYSQAPPLQCSDITRQGTQKLRCNLTVEEGHLNAFCNIRVGWPDSEYAGTIHLKNGSVLFYPFGEKLVNDSKVLMIKLYLVSSEPVASMTAKDAPAGLYLRRVWVNKWLDYEGNDDYAIFWASKERLGPFAVDFIPDYIEQISFSTIFNRPPQAAAAVCRETQNDGRCSFDIYGFLHSSYNSTLQDDLKAFVKHWNIGYSSTELVNITLHELHSWVTTAPFLLTSVARIRNVLFYKCNYDSIDADQIPVIKGIEHLAFVQAPIEEVSEIAFEKIPHVKRISLVGTRLPGIPKAIFKLRQLDKLDMSDTNTLIDMDFGYSSAKLPQNSTATRLILKGSKLSTLPSRAFCAFPMLEELALDNCHLRDIPGSPFECLEHLKVLSISNNHIKSLYGKNVQGLVSLVYLDMSNNDVAYFQGSYALSTLVSLRTLRLADNKLRKLELYSQNEIKIEEINLEGNHLQLWEPPLFTRMRELKKLSFAHNDITQIDYNMLHDIQHVSNVDFRWNPWDCFSCDLNNLHSLLQMHPANCNDCFSCGQPPDLRGVDVHNVTWREDDCAPPDYYRVYGIPALLCFMATTVLVNFVYRNRWYFMSAFLCLKLSIKQYKRRQKPAGSFLWDCFLSYHVSDADWVCDVLLPRLESPPMQFRLCVAERDFIPGIEITENICRAIAGSRRSLFVLSREFCRSRWCMFELSLAQHRLLESDCEDAMVFIKKNDVRETEMCSTLQCMTKSRTYIQLPPDGSSETQKNLFWDQLKVALQ